MNDFQGQQEYRPAGHWLASGFFPLSHWFSGVFAMLASRSPISRGRTVGCPPSR